MWNNESNLTSTVLYITIYLQKGLSFKFNYIIKSYIKRYEQDVYI